jgi:hypothetical protein
MTAPTNTVDQSRLVLNAFAARFENNLLAADLVTWKQYDGSYDARNGYMVSEQVEPRYTVTHTTGGIKDLSAGVQATAFGSEMFTVNDSFGVSMGWAEFDRVKNIGDARESVAIKAAANNLAEQLDSYIMGVAGLAANNQVGTPANNVATYADVAKAYTRLKKEGVDDTDLRMVLSYDDRESISTAVVAYTATDSLSTQTFRKGFEGEINGIPTMFTQQLSSITTGTRTTPAAVKGASQNVNYKDVCKSTTANGRYLTQTLIIDGLGNSKTIKDGEIFTIAGVYAWDNRKQQVLSHLQQFRVVGDVTSDAADGSATVRIFPAIVIGDTDQNSAHRTVSAVPADDAVITFAAAASTTYTPRFIIQKPAIVVSTMDLPSSFTDTNDRVSLTKVPMSVRMWKHTDWATGDQSIRFDCVATANVKDRRRIVRLNGAS